MNENRGKFTLQCAQQYLGAEPEMRVEKLTDRTWTITNGHIRSVFIEGNESVIACDTFGTPGQARAYRKSLEKATGNKPVSTIIYSHDHIDHAGFAADLAPQARIIADELCARVIKLRNAEGQLTPNHIVSGRETMIEVDGVKLVLANPGPTHGSGNISVFLPEDRIIYSSDTVLGNARYGLLPDYHIGNFVSNIRTLLDYDWDMFVPGRYEMTDRAGFRLACDFIEAVKVESQKAFAEFVPVWSYDSMYEYAGDKLRERYGELPYYEENIGLMALRIVHHYIMGGWGMEDTPQAKAMLAEKVSL